MYPCCLDLKYLASKGQENLSIISGEYLDPSFFGESLGIQTLWSTMKTDSNSDMLQCLRILMTDLNSCTDDFILKSYTPIKTINLDGTKDYKIQKLNKNIWGRWISLEFYKVVSFVGMKNIFMQRGISRDLMSIKHVMNSDPDQIRLKDISQLVLHELCKNQRFADKIIFNNIGTINHSNKKYGLKRVGDVIYNTIYKNEGSMDSGDIYCLSLGSLYYSTGITIKQGYWLTVEYKTRFHTEWRNYYLQGVNSKNIYQTIKNFIDIQCKKASKENKHLKYVKLKIDFRNKILEG